MGRLGGVLDGRGRSIFGQIGSFPPFAASSSSSWVVYAKMAGVGNGAVSKRIKISIGSGLIVRKGVRGTKE